MVCQLVCHLSRDKLDSADLIYIRVEVIGIINKVYRLTEKAKNLRDLIDTGY